MRAGGVAGVRALPDFGWRYRLPATDVPGAGGMVE